MKNTIIRVLCFALIAAFIVMPFVTGTNTASAQTGTGGALFTNVTGKVDMSAIAMQNLNTSATTSTAGKKHTVIVSLSGNTLVDEANGADVSEFAQSAEGKKVDSKLRASQDEFLQKLTKNGISYKLKYRYTAVDNAVAITIDTKYVSQIKKLAGVKSVVLSETYLAPQSVDMGTYAQASDEDLDNALKNATAVINKTSVYDTGVYDSSDVMQNYGYKGGGSVVAVIDTGLDYTHNAFVWDEAHSSVYSLDKAVFSKSTIENLLANKTMQAEERSLLKGKVIDVNDVYISQKVPFAYDYADSDPDVYPSYSNHGTHVAGIVAGYDPDGYTDKNGEHVDEPFVGVAPEAQLVICKVFTDDLDDEDIGGAETEDILAALEDCILLGVDVINMSLGTSCGFSTTDDGDEEGESLNRVYNAVGEAGISLICAASNDYSASYGGNFGTNLSSNPDSGTVGSPSLFAAALSVASISGKTSPFFMANPTDSYDGTPVYFEESSDQYNKYYEFATMILNGEERKTFEYVRISGVGRASDFNNVSDKLPGKIALIKRGSTTFKEKVELAMSYGAIGVIVYNNVAGTIRMSLGEIEDPVPSCCISMDAGNAMAEYASAHGGVGTIVVDESLSAGPFMSEFSSWGVTPDLKLKPEITAHGGEITSAVPGGYGEQSGTSMASPNMAGVVSIIRSYLKETQPTLSTNELTQRINQLVMSTANIVYDRDSLPYSPRKQGAGLGSLDNAISTRVYLYTNDSSVDYRPKVNLGDDEHKTGIYTINFGINNFGEQAYSFDVKSLFMTETLSSDGLAVAEQAHMLDDIPFELTVSGGITKDGNTITVPQGTDGQISVKLTLSGDERNYIDDSFSNGMYVEGFIQLVSATESQCNLVIPFLGFYGDWAQAPMLEYSAYEVAENEQDTSIPDEEKIKASIWATQPYTMYYNELYSMPMGSFSYLQDENADKMYTSMEHNAVSCYNVFYGDDHPENYLTAYQFRGLYVGLLRGARKVSYNLKNVDTGEILYENEAFRINKAFTQGGAGGVPGFIEFEIPPLEYGMVSNGKYEMNFYFYLDYGDKDREEYDDEFSFTFYADYEAPVIDDVRVRYQDYKENNKDKQRIYLDLDVFDNHYPQSALLCYFDGELLQQVTQYVTPIYNSVKNGISTVSIEITDVYEKYKSQLYVQIDDFALNHSVYYLNLDNASVSQSADDFELVAGEEEIELDIYETHKVKLNYSGDANISNFSWGSNAENVARVKNGEIVGLSEGDAIITVSNANGKQKQINVSVTSNKKRLSTPTLSFETLADGNDKLVAGSGGVTLYPDQDVQLLIQTDPWWYPKETLNLSWESTDPSIASVDQEGNLDIKKKGTVSIKAVLLNDKGNPTAYSAVLTIYVPDPFIISGYTLTEYRGKDKLVEIPDDKTIMYIGDEAFKDNDTMEEVIIPKTVMNINEKAFENCSALKAIYLVSKDKQPIPDADLKLIYRNAFINCTSLELIDLTNVKVITLGVNAFMGCTSLKEIKNMNAIGTAFSGAFQGCTSLKSIDIQGMHVTGESVFRGCTNLSEVITGKYTAIGDYMFANCTSLKSIEINGSTVGANAFENCARLTTVHFGSVDSDCTIGSEAFLNSALRKVTYADGFTALKIGNRAFKNTSLTEVTLPEGLIELGEGLFENTLSVSKIILPASFTFEQISFSGTLFTGIEVSISSDSDYVIEDGVLYNKDKSILLALYDNSKTSVTIPESVVSIYDYAFAQSKILEVTIPASVKSIGNGAFKGSKVINVTFEGEGITAIGKETFRNSGLNSIVLPSSVNSIGEYAFAQSAITAISLDVEEIAEHAFDSCSKLKTVTISDKLQILGDDAFLKCELVEEITLPSAKEVGQGVFIGMKSLKKVVIGDGVETLGEFTFYALPELESVELGSSITIIPESTFFACTKLKSVKHKGIVEVEEYAFAYCNSLSEFDFSTVEIIGDMAFNNCNGLKVLNLDSAREIGIGAFAMDNLRGGVTSINLAVAEEIGNSAFESTNITTVTIPASVKKIGFASFGYCENLTEILVSLDNTVYYSDNGILYKNSASGGIELVAYPIGKVWNSEVFVVSEGVIRIEAHAFAGLEKDIPENGETSEAGEGVVTLKKVELPQSLLSIGDSAFYKSGIVEYTFTSVNAPVLESVYKEEVEEILQDNFENYEDPALNSYYYSNFNTLFVYYIDMVGETSPLIINRPTNGVGYDNFVYSRYFGINNESGIVKDETTNGFIEIMDSFVDDSVFTLWEEKINQGDNSYLNDVEAFAEIVKEARRLYGNIKDESQLAYVDQALVSILEEAEVRMRNIKALYGISAKIRYLTYEKTGYKYDYVEGEHFDMTGLKVSILYDDGSTESVDSKNLSLLTTGELKYYNQDVEIIYCDDEGNPVLNSSGKPYTVFVGVKVQQVASGDDDDTSDDIVDNNEEENNLLGLWIALGVVGGLVVVAGVAVAVVLALKKKKNSLIASSDENVDILSDDSGDILTEENDDEPEDILEENQESEANNIDGDEDNDL